MKKSYHIIDNEAKQAERSGQELAQLLSRQGQWLLPLPVRRPKLDVYTPIIDQILETDRIRRSRCGCRGRLTARGYLLRRR